MYFGIKATTGKVIDENRSGVWLTRTARRKTEQEEWKKAQSGDDRGGFRGARNVEDETMDGERLEGELGNEKLDMEERVPVPKREYVSREDLVIFGFTASFLGCVSMFKGAARQAHTENRQRIEVESHRDGGSTTEWRMRASFDKAVERRTKRTRSRPGEMRTDTTTTPTTPTNPSTSGGAALSKAPTMARVTALSKKDAVVPGVATRCSLGG